MSDFIVFVMLFLLIFFLFLTSFKSFLNKRYIRKQLHKGIRHHKQDIRLAKGDSAQLFEIYKRVYNYTVYSPKKFFMPKNRFTFEEQVNRELNRLIKNPFTKLGSGLTHFFKGIFSFALLLGSILFGAIVVDEFQASSLTLPTIDPDFEMNLEIDWQDRMNHLFTNVFVQSEPATAFEFASIEYDAIDTDLQSKDYPSSVTTTEELGQAIAYHMSHFENEFTIYYEGERTNFDQSLQDVYGWLEENEPYLWAIRGVAYSQYIDYGNIIELQMAMDYDLTAEEHALVVGVIKQIINTLPTGATEIEKVKFVNDFIVSRTKYNMDSEANPHTPYSVLINGEGVCEGYALAALLMLEELGIETKYVIGHVPGGLHAWNLVKVDGEWYHLDVTWNDPIPDQGKKVRYDYFLITDQQIGKDHEWVQTDYPASATKSYSF